MVKSHLSFPSFLIVFPQIAKLAFCIFSFPVPVASPNLVTPFCLYIGHPHSFRFRFKNSSYPIPQFLSENHCFTQYLTHPFRTCYPSLLLSVPICCLNLIFFSFSALNSTLLSSSFLLRESLPSSKSAKLKSPSL